jgi:5'-deoxynucleotidase YfbR-like HD superfamily hydrolase
MGSSFVAPSVFLSHSSVNKTFVRRVKNSLEQYKIKTWLDESNIKPGESITESLQKGLVECDVLLIFLTPHSIQSGWVKAEWQSRFAAQISTRKVRVIPLLVELCEIPEFLKDVKYIDFRSDYDTGIAQLLSTLLNGHLKLVKKDVAITKMVSGILEDLNTESIVLPFAGRIPIIKTLKRLPRSGKHLRIGDLRLADGRKLPSRSLYDHVLSVAHSAEVLFDSIGHGLSGDDKMDVARCIAMHEINEILLGDIPTFTRLNDRRRHKTRIEAEQTLATVPPREREYISHRFIWMFLSPKNREVMDCYFDISKNDRSKVFRYFKLMDKIDPIVGIWRYLHVFRERFHDGGDLFISRMSDFFTNPDPRRRVRDYGSDQKLLELLSFLQNQANAQGYCKSNDAISGASGLFSIPSSKVIELIESNELLFMEFKAQTKNARSTKASN